MLQILKLLLPALIPSWRFFETVAPSPRIEFALLDDAKTAPDEYADQWREFRSRPARLSPLDMMKRMVWNPHWNETLFLVSCAERIIAGETEHSPNQIIHRICRDVSREKKAAATPSFVRFRLCFVDRDGEDRLQKHMLYVSAAYPLHPDGAA